MNECKPGGNCGYCNGKAYCDVCHEVEVSYTGETCAACLVECSDDHAADEAVNAQRERDDEPRSHITLVLDDEGNDVEVPWPL